MPVSPLLRPPARAWFALLFVLGLPLLSAQTFHQAWVTTGTGPDTDRIHAAAALPDGGVFVAGSFLGSITLGTGQPHQTQLSAQGTSWDLFVARYDASGQLLWARRDGGSGWEEPTDAAATPDGGVVVVGKYDATAYFGVGDSTQAVLLSFGKEDLFVARYDADGHLVWARRAGGAYWDVPWGVAVHAQDGRVWIAGVFESTATFGVESTTPVVLSSSGRGDLFLACYTAAGQLQWARRAGGAEQDEALGVAVNPQGRAFVVGLFSSSAQFGGIGQGGPVSLTSPGQLRLSDAFIAAYESDGSLGWVVQAGGDQGWEWAHRAAATSDGGVLALGRAFHSTSLGAGTLSSTTLIPPSAGGHFVARYDAGGQLLWAQGAGGTGRSEAFTLALQAGDRPLVAGRWAGEITFGTSEAGPVTLTGQEPGEAFLAQLDADGSLLSVDSLYTGPAHALRALAASAPDHFFAGGYFMGMGSFGADIAVAVGKEDSFLLRLNVVTPTPTPTAPPTPTVTPTPTPVVHDWRECDYNHDGVVDDADLMYLMEHWHETDAGMARDDVLWFSGFWRQGDGQPWIP